LRAIPCHVSGNFFPRSSTFENEKPAGEAIILGIGIVRIGARSRSPLSRPPSSFLGKNAIKFVPLYNSFSTPQTTPPVPFPGENPLARLQCLDYGLANVGQIFDESPIEVCDSNEYLKLFNRSGVCLILDIFHFPIGHRDSGCLDNVS